MIGEDEPIEDDEAERLKDGPEHAERRTGETGVEVSLDEFPEEMDVSVRVRELLRT